MAKTFRFLVLGTIATLAVFTNPSGASSAGAAPEDAYRTSLERMKAGDYDRAIASALVALAESGGTTAEPGPQAIERATALELIARYEVRTNRIDLGVRHLSEALAVMLTTFNADHPRVVSVKSQIREAERKRF